MQLTTYNDDDVTTEMKIHELELLDPIDRFMFDSEASTQSMFVPSFKHQPGNLFVGKYVHVLLN